MHCVENTSTFCLTMTAGWAGIGPRYCPSIHLKVQRFPDRDRHLIWLEPEGIDSNLVYPNGMSGPYPQEIQQKIINSCIGLEDAQIASPGYDVEYDYCDPRSLKHTLESKSVRGLFSPARFVVPLVMRRQPHRVLLLALTQA